jgi:hypothetical protein
MPLPPHAHLRAGREVAMTRTTTDLGWLTPPQGKDEHLRTSVAGKTFRERERIGAGKRGGRQCAGLLRPCEATSMLLGTGRLAAASTHVEANRPERRRPGGGRRPWRATLARTSTSRDRYLPTKAARNARQLPPRAHARRRSTHNDHVFDPAPLSLLRLLSLSPSPSLVPFLFLLPT